MVNVVPVLGQCLLITGVMMTDLSCSHNTAVLSPRGLRDVMMTNLTVIIQLYFLLVG